MPSRHRAFVFITFFLLPLARATATPVILPPVSFGLAISLTPALPDAADSIQIDVTGSFPNACYSVQSSSTGSALPDISVSVFATYQPLTCAQVITPFDVKSTIGLLPAGLYHVQAALYQNGLFQQSASKSFSVTPVPEVSTTFSVCLPVLFLALVYRRRSRRIPSPHPHP